MALITFVRKATCKNVFQMPIYRGNLKGSNLQRYIGKIKNTENNNNAHKIYKRPRFTWETLVGKTHQPRIKVFPFVLQ